MVTLLKKSRIGLVALGAMALMAIAGWQFGSNGTQEEFSGKEVAMENAIAGVVVVVSGGNFLKRIQ
jgi:acyl CoA:acetate/3-ketoacid CoA transferase alpha subunit